jgi:glycosyltransferase involved in cell wall biosynthesis
MTRVAVDIRVAYGARTGMALVAGRLAVSLSNDKVNEYLLFPLIPTWPRLLKRAQGIIHELLWKQILFPLELAIQRIDVVVYTYPIISLASFKPSVVMIYDMLCYDEPTERSFRNTLSFSLLRLAAKRSRIIVTISHFSKDRIVRCLKVNPDKVLVAYPGCPEVSCRGTLPRSLQELSNSGGGFFLAVLGALQPRKNALALLRAFDLILKHGGPLRKLVIVTSQSGSDWPKVRKILGQGQLSDHVILLSPTDRGDLVELYRQARLLVHTTLYDGFGLPVLEAMTLGTPVIISNTASLPEIADGCAIEVDPGDYASIAKAIMLVDSNEPLRRKLQESGRNRASEFTWEKMATVLRSTITTARRHDCEPNTSS